MYYIFLAFFAFTLSFCAFLTSAISKEAEERLMQKDGPGFLMSFIENKKTKLLENKDEDPIHQLPIEPDENNFSFPSDNMGHDEFSERAYGKSPTANNGDSDMTTLQEEDEGKLVELKSEKDFSQN